MHVCVCICMQLCVYIVGIGRHMLYICTYTQTLFFCQHCGCHCCCWLLPRAPEHEEAAEPESRRPTIPPTIPPSPRQQRGSPQPPQCLPDTSGMGSPSTSPHVTLGEKRQVGKIRQQVPLATNRPLSSAPQLAPAAVSQL